MTADDSSAFMGAVNTFDETVDAAFERFRGNPSVDRFFETATKAGEFSAIWHVAGLARGLLTGRLDQTVALAVGIGAESLIVNQGIKRIFRRKRPMPAGDERFELRTPMTSSFPSGHASAAAFAAVTLVRWNGKRSLPLWGPLAAAVAVSRPYVRIHHASDIVGGALVGSLLARIARQLYRRLGVE